MRLFSCCCFLFLSCYFANAQGNQLTVSDVRQSWYAVQGTIEKATLSVRPKGAYLEYGLYLTFSAQGATFYTNGDSLEVVLNFTLPANAIVHDSWLWVGEDIIKARIYDRWAASTIYEGIVKRRQDPSILTKNSAPQYQLRVFPMTKTSTRKVKITWLQPADFYNNRTDVSLPFPILKTSKNTVPQFDVLVWSDDRFQAPSIASRPDLSFEAVSDTAAGNFFRITLTPELYIDDIRLRFASPFHNGSYLGTYSEGGENFYQLGIIPSYFLSGEQHRKVALLCDYETSATAISNSNLLIKMKNALLGNLIPGDSFNLFFSNLVIKKASNHWLPAHPDTIEKAFAALNDQLSNYSNLQPLLVSTIQWIHEQGVGGDMLLATNSTQFANLQSANFLLTDVLHLLDPPLAIHVVDFNEKTSPYFYANGVYYYANSYFLTNLAALSGGAYAKTLSTQTLVKALDSGLSNLGATLEAFELAPAPENGFCYGKFNINSSATTTNLFRPVFQVGKFAGDPPFHFEINGFYHNQLWHYESEIAEPALNADTLLREMWYGRFLQTLESEAQSSSTIGSIIYRSLAERVLSTYTAFLCLDNPAWICPECEDESQFTNTDEPGARDSVLLAYPNPFADRTTIEIRAGTSSREQISLEIYNIKAQLMRQFELGTASEENRVEWAGTDGAGREVPPGVYLALLRTGDQIRILKLVKMRP